jgi:hypothetical protein
MAVTIIVRRGGRPGGVPPDPPGDITTLATLNWTNGLGTSTYAWTDGDPTRNQMCDPSTVNPVVRAAADEGWTGPGNVLRMQNSRAGCGGVLLQDVMPEPAEGAWWIVRASVKQSADQIYDQLHTHVGFSPSGLGTAKVVLNRIVALGSGNWCHALSLAPADFAWELHVVGSPGTRISLAPDTWYRIEVAIRWFGLDGNGDQLYRAYPRMYNPAGELIGTEANYVAQYVSGVSVNQSMADFYAGGGHLVYPSANIGHPNVGENPRDFWCGVSRSQATDEGHYYWAGVNVGTATQQAYFGPY